MQISLPTQIYPFPNLTTAKLELRNIGTWEPSVTSLNEDLFLLHNFHTDIPAS